jgi:hypothetical protein
MCQLEVEPVSPCMPEFYAFSMPESVYVALASLRLIKDLQLSMVLCLSWRSSMGVCGAL